MLRANALILAAFSIVTFALMSSSIASSAVRLSARSELHHRARLVSHYIEFLPSRGPAPGQALTSPTLRRA